MRFPDRATEFHDTKNCTLTLDTVSYLSREKVWWRCKVNKSHEFQMAPTQRRSMSGGKCPMCLAQCSLAVLSPKIATEFHPSKNGRLTALNVSNTSRRLVWWQCRKDTSHEFQAKVSDRTLRSEAYNCPGCNGPSNFASAYPHVAMQLHPTKNGELEPSTVPLKSKQQFWWRCTRNGEHVWFGRYAARYVSSLVTLDCTVCGGRCVAWCPYCADFRDSVVYAESIAAIYPALAKDFHPSKNQSFGAGDLSPTSQRLVWWRCARVAGHEWEERVRDRVKR
eukprot:993041_1